MTKMATAAGAWRCGILVVLSGMVLVAGPGCKKDRTCVGAVQVGAPVMWAENMSAPMCRADPFGDLGVFNLLTLEGLTLQGTAVGGRVAVGQDAILDDVTIGTALALDRTRADLIVGHNLDFSSGSVSNGAIVHGHAAEVADGVQYAALLQGNRLDFADAEAVMHQISAELLSLNVFANGGVAIEQPAGEGSRVTLTGQDPNVNLFDLSSEQLFIADQLSITAPAGSVVVINVTGDPVRLAPTTITMDGVGSESVIIHFTTALEATIGGTDLKGLVFAPKTTVTFDDAQIDGSVIARSLTGSGGMSLTRFEGCLPVSMSRTCLDACGDGFECVNGVCQDVDECVTDPQRCGMYEACVNVVGGHRCDCIQGFLWDAEEGCVDLDECKAGTAACRANEACTNTVGGYTCDCMDGFERDERERCVDVDECVGDPCGDHQACFNKLGSFDCECVQGFVLIGEECQDMDECGANPNLCGTNEVCSNTMGSFQCECEDGFARNDGDFCVDVDECEDDTNDCSENAACTNVAGGFVCTCLPGFVGDGVTCTKP